MKIKDAFNLFRRCQGVDESSRCDRCRHGKFRLLPVILCFLLIVYLFLYTNSFDNIDISLILKTVQKGPASIWNNTIDFLSDLKSPKNISNNQLKLAFITSSTNPTVLPHSSQLLTTNTTVLSYSSQLSATNPTVLPHSSQLSATNPTVLPHSSQLSATIPTLLPHSLQLSATIPTLLPHSSQLLTTNPTVSTQTSQLSTTNPNVLPHSSQLSATNPTALYHSLQPPATNLTVLSLPSHPPAVPINKQNESSPWKQSIRELTKNRTKPLLTLMTSWIESEDKYLVHNLTTLNWLSLRPFVLPIVFTNSQPLAKVCKGAGWVVLPLRVTAAEGVPVLKYMYIDAIKMFESDFYAFANSDILFTDTLVETLIGILQNNSTSDNSTQGNSAIQNHILVVGRRTNVYNISMEEGSSWSGIKLVAKNRGKLFQINAEDYFITSPSYPWNDIPEVVIGRRAYDNWLVLNARKQKHKVIDATNTILAVHHTTNQGNYEGMTKKNSDHNHNLLVHLYKSVQYDLGVTECAEYRTINAETFVIMSRDLPKHCTFR